jgi:hypothetical protein
MMPRVGGVLLSDQHPQSVVQPVERGGCEYEFSRQYPTFNQDRYQVADEFADLSTVGHRTLLSILEKQHATSKSWQKGNLGVNGRDAVGCSRILLKTLLLDGFPQSTACSALLV